ncbi:MAG TPA: hypothetical protein PKA10_12300, partial [Selenomonadales bacterium]|nr:hypothetical protein [Selenomonadales bacterium]
MKKKVSIITVIVMLAVATAFAAPSDQPNNGNQMNQMYQYCNQAMQQWGNGNASNQGEKTGSQAQSTSYHSGMMSGNSSDVSHGNMMGNGSHGNMMGNGSHGNMMGNG